MGQVMKRYDDLTETQLSSEEIFKGVVVHLYKDMVRLTNGEESVREGGVTVSFSPAQVSAVVVVYEGRDSLILKERIVDMVSTLYGIGYHRVSVNPV